MRLTLFTVKGVESSVHRVGALLPNGASIADVTAALADTGIQVNSMRVFLDLEAKGTAAAHTAIANSAYHISLENVVLKAPILDR
jgi:hypothetical protein